MNQQTMMYIYDELERILGRELGTLLREKDIPTHSLDRIIKETYSVKEVENMFYEIEHLNASYFKSNNEELIDDMVKQSFSYQAKKINAIQDTLTQVKENAEHIISILPKLLEELYNSQMDNISRSYLTKHKNMDLVNLKQAYLENQPNKEDNNEFFVSYLKGYFNSVLQNKISNETFKKCKIYELDNFKEKYDELLTVN